MTIRNNNSWMTTALLRLLLLLLLYSPVVFVNASQAVDHCSDTLSCFHGGQCKTWTNDETGDTNEYCFCSDLSEGRFVGIECDLIAPSDPDEWCNPYGDFCLHGGECIMDDDEDMTPTDDNDKSHIKICDCPKEYTGRYCELHVNSPQVQAHVKEEDANKPIEESCTLDCQNDGLCEFGHRPPNFAEITAETTEEEESSSENVNAVGYQYCSCPRDFFGTRCEHQVEICGYDGDLNPQHHCHNGATCVDKHMLRIPEERLEFVPPFLCDCVSVSTPTQRYTGPYCEYTNIHMCNKDESNVDSRTYCVNDGTCVKEESNNDDGDGGESNLSSSSSLWTCQCSDDFEGKHCEYSKQINDEEDSSSNETTTTNLLPPANETCQNTECHHGGQCYFGPKDTSDTVIGKMLSQHPGGELDHILMGKSGEMGANENYEHCHCPSGFTGVHCEIKFTTCQNNNDEDDYACFHDSECVPDDAIKCSCNNREDLLNENDLSLTGDYCENRATSRCGEGWCFNGGECQDDLQISCNCPKGWSGPDCTISEPIALIDDDDAYPTIIMEDDEVPCGEDCEEEVFLSGNMNPILIILIALIVVISIMIVVIAVILTKRKRQRNRAFFRPTTSTIGTKAPPLSTFQKHYNIAALLNTSEFGEEEHADRRHHHTNNVFNVNVLNVNNIHDGKRFGKRFPQPQDEELTVVELI